MGIKIEHQGNAASRIVASNLGGQAQANEKQSLALAQKTANENAASNRQLSVTHATAQPGHASVSPTHAGFVGAPNPADYAARAKLDFENAVGLTYARANANVAQKPSIAGTDLDPRRQKTARVADDDAIRGLVDESEASAAPASPEPAAQPQLQTAFHNPIGLLGSQAVSELFGSLAVPRQPNGLETQFNSALQTASAALKRRLRGLDGVGDPYGDRIAPTVDTPVATRQPPTPSAALAAIYQGGGNYYGNGGVMGNKTPFRAGTVDDTQKLWEMI